MQPWLKMPGCCPPVRICNWTDDCNHLHVPTHNVHGLSNHKQVEIARCEAAKKGEGTAKMPCPRFQAQEARLKKLDSNSRAQEARLPSTAPSAIARQVATWQYARTEHGLRQMHQECLTCQPRGQVLKTRLQGIFEIAQSTVRAVRNARIRGAPN